MGGRGDVGFVPERLRVGSVWMGEWELIAGLGESGVERSWDAEIDGRSRLGVVAPLRGRCEPEATSAPFDEGPTEENEPFCDLLSVEEVP